ncbi:MAG: SGNH/GDSL hydrolase family protein [Candidatus Omnitrophica bacterium]|nr:SGNH/GDSL hydrolase family protein [Candidatus Omnitrophota bacterium]
MIMRFIRFIVLEAVLVILFALIAEGVAQGIFFIRKGYTFKRSLLYVPDKDLVYKLNPRYKGDEIISNGFRGEPFLPEKPDGVYRIIAMGGSTTWGGNASYRDSWPYLLEEMLNKNTGGRLRFEVINAGVCGYGSAQQYIRLNKEIFNYHPDMIIIHSGWNLTGALDNDVYYWVPDNIVKPNAPLLEKAAAFLTGNSVIFAKFRARFPRYLDAFDLTPAQRQQLEEHFITLVGRHKQYLTDMVRLAEAHKVVPVLVKYPQIYHADARDDEALKRAFPDLFKYRELFNREYALTTGAIGLTAQETGAPLLDFSDCFDALPAGKKCGFFLDQMHVTDEGLAIEAQAIYNGLARLLKEAYGT